MSTRVNSPKIVHEYCDAAVSGADPVDTRPGFTDMLAYMLSIGARTIIVENASGFARDLIVQETGYQALKAKGIELIAADSPDRKESRFSVAHYLPARAPPFNEWPPGTCPGDRPVRGKMHSSAFPQH